MGTVLIIEDHEDINHMLGEALTDAGHQVKSLYNGADGLTEIRNNCHDLIILDIMLPFLNGDELLTEVRSLSETPVIMISAKDKVGTKIDLLKQGADDYITKPFDLGEVVARVESNLRRSQRLSNSNKLFNYKDLVLDDDTKHVTVNNCGLDLTAKEYMILELLVKHHGKVFTKANLYETLWPEDDSGDDQTVKTHVSNLRSKLKKANPQAEYIETVWGLGYRLFKD